MGGANAYIMGDGLESDPQSNTVLMSTSAITGSMADFAVPYLSEDEAFLAGTAAGKLSVFIPSLETLTSIPKS